MEKYIVNKSLSEGLSISQPKNGYRITIDPVILSTQLTPPPGSRILDMGCGCGIMPLLIAHLNPDTKIIGVELQKELADHARQNVIDNSFEHRIQIIHENICNVSPTRTKGLVDIVISNPPYMKKGQGRLNANEQKALARHEISLDIKTVCQRAHDLLRKTGDIYIIFPFQRQKDLIDTLEACGFHSVSILRIHGTEDKPPIRILIHAKKKMQSKSILKPPIYLQDSLRAHPKTVLPGF